MEDLRDPINIFSISDHLTREQLEQYHLGQMPRGERHEVEMHLVDCELCKDALSGIALMHDYKGIDRIRKDLRKIAKPKHGPMHQVAWRNVIITVIVLSLIILITLYFLYLISKTR